MLHSFYLSLTLDLLTYLPLLLLFIHSYISTFHLEIVLFSLKKSSVFHFKIIFYFVWKCLLFYLYSLRLFFFLLNAREIFHCCLASNILIEKAGLIKWYSLEVNHFTIVAFNFLSNFQFYYMFQYVFFFLTCHWFIALESVVCSPDSGGKISAII